jgi:RNA polymerase sigma factor (sigma-70 family)
MTQTRPQSILSYLRKVLGTPAGGGVTDAELLSRFVQARDEAAFELLLWRHAAMVLHVCRRLLREDEAAADAFQATFLIFVRKAASISRREALGGWLYRVAYHTALKAREQKFRRQSVEQEASRLDVPVPEADAAEQREIQRLICEEVNRLPARYRTPIVACFFEGKTHEEAAHQLGWPRGTVASRLARARELLRRRLVRRGVALSAGALASTLPVPTSQAALTGLIQVTLQTLNEVAAGAVVSPRIAALAEGALTAMYRKQLKTVMAVLILGLLSGAGAILLASPRDKPEPPRAAAEPKKVTDATKEIEEANKLAHNMAQSRLNLRKLALAFMHDADAHTGMMLPPAVPGKDGKDHLSWRVLLLPYLGERELYEQFKLSEPWDSPHNKKLLSKMPKVYAPPGVTPREPYSTFYQVFVTPKKEVVGLCAAFLQGQQLRYPASFTDGTANTILIVEAGNAVPWTKPDDLPYDSTKPLPELGGLFREVFHAAFADGHVETLTHKFDEYSLRCVITSNGGEVMDFDRIRARISGADWRRKNRELTQELEDARERLLQLQRDRDVLRGRPIKKDPADAGARVEELKKENERLRKELEKVKEESKAVDEETLDLLQKGKKP